MSCRTGQRRPALYPTRVVTYLFVFSNHSKNVRSAHSALPGGPTPGRVLLNARPIAVAGCKGNHLFVARKQKTKKIAARRKALSRPVAAEGKDTALKANDATICQKSFAQSLPRFGLGGQNYHLPLKSEQLTKIIFDFSDSHPLNRGAKIEKNREKATPFSLYFSFPVQRATTIRPYAHDTNRYLQLIFKVLHVSNKFFR